MKITHFSVLIMIALLLLSLSTVFAAGIPEGYAGLKWGTEAQAVMKQYKGGETSKIHDEVLYKQTSPNKEIATRVFMFKDNKLTAVSVKFDAEYVMKIGIDSLLAQHKQAYGEGTLDKSKGPHMTTFIWDGRSTRITYAYAPKRPDMCVILFQQK
jgi:hypothetical protein